ncbi:hypothetical protein H5410_027189 [Solanum commersonii]|uniref:Uncharacterized protein n=1 Tax=Solanum commersonii TaxID=4109 RepID=A0A9J5YYJ6_SOLCO|nr:hypothetical protein H5410_027189 [Solanum commersonii]
MYLEEQYKRLYSKWIDISPKLISLQRDNIFFEGMSLMHFFIEFSIPWIMKWSVEVDNTSKRFPCLQRTFYTKFWNKLLHKDLESKIHGQEILYLKIKQSTNTIIQQITRKLPIKKGIISKSEAIAMYMEEVKRDLIKNLDIDIGDDISMASASQTNNDDEGCIAGETQSDQRNDEIDIDALLAKFQEQVEESSNRATCKGKDKI